MCNCIEPPKGRQPAAPTPENLADYKEAYGDMVLAKLVGSRVAEAPVSFRGPATRVFYGRRAKGDVFFIWQADLEQSGDTFEQVHNFSVEPEPTVVPEPPPPEPLQAQEQQTVVTIDDVPEVAPPVKVQKPAPPKPVGKSSIHRSAQAKSKGRK